MKKKIAYLLAKMLAVTLRKISIDTDTYDHEERILDHLSELDSSLSAVQYDYDRVAYAYDNGQAINLSEIKNPVYKVAIQLFEEGEYEKAKELLQK